MLDQRKKIIQVPFIMSINKISFFLRPIGNYRFNKTGVVSQRTHAPNQLNLTFDNGTFLVNKICSH